MIFMKKIILPLAIGILCWILGTNILYAQTNGGNNGGSNQGQTPPSYQNPYRDEVTPFINGKKDDENFFKDDNKNTIEKKDNRPTDPNKENTTIDISDRNAQDIYKSQDELRAQYKNDPDYLKYLNGRPDNEDIDSTSRDSKNRNTEDEVYGLNFLSAGGSFSNTANLTTVPEDYRLGVGDEITVYVYGASELQESYTISKDGSIFPYKVGKINLQGLSFLAARNIIESRFKRILPPGSNVDMSMGKLRTIRVSVNCEVYRSGTLTMSALNTAINAIQLAGGINQFGNLRDIEIIRNGFVVEHLDIYEYLSNGNRGRNIYLEDNDIIRVKIYDKIVSAKGGFKRPMKYQLSQYETLNDLIELAGGVKFDARKSLIRVKTIFKEQEQYIDIPGDNITDYSLRDGDEVTVNPINEGVSNIVSIEGAVAYPDVYQIVPNMRVFDLIEKAGGLNPNSYRPRAFIFRSGNRKDESIAKKIDLTDFGNASSAQNILLENGDLVKILSESQFDQNFSIEVKGLVRKPGTIPYKPNLALKDVLLLVGGLSLAAESGRIEISNVVDTFSRYSISGNNVNVRTVSISPNLEIDKVSEKIVIKPYDIIYIRKKKNIIRQQNVMLIGEVDYAGPYALLGNSEHISSLIIRSGGLTADAYPEGAKLYRKKIGPIIINLRDAIRNAGGKDDITLEEGDTILIPTKSDVVRVTGEVQMPVNLKYDKENRGVLNYISGAGGFGDRPWRRRIAVQYQNGRYQKTKSFLFFKFYPKVKPGSMVVVPRRPDREKVDVKEIVQYSLTSLTTIFTIYILSKNIN